MIYHTETMKKSKYVSKLTIVFGLVATFITLSINVAAQNFPSQPSPPKIVNDFAGILTPEQQNALEQKLVQYDREGSTQIAIVTVPTLDGYEVDDYAVQLAEKWGIGQHGKNNGILILVKPKQGNDKGQAYIATGYGLEEFVPDALTNRIIDVEMIPEFKQNNYYSGLDKATNVIISLTQGKFSPQEYENKTSGTKGIGIIPLILLFIIIFSIFGKMRRAKHYSIGHKVPFWVALGMMGASKGSHQGSFGGFSSGSGGFGGGGGGFGGFGGGSFGGGGAGGSW